MATVTVKLPSSPGSRYPKVSIVAESGGIVTLPYAPNEIQLTNNAPAFTQQPRPGSDPLLQRAGGQLAEMRFTATVVRPDSSPVDDVLAQLLWVIASGERVRVGYELLTGGLWRITASTFTTVDHEPGTNRCIKATVELVFTKASDVSLNVGPASGGTKSAAKPVPTVARGGDSGTALQARTRSTLSLGALADANGIRDFRKVPAGASVRPGS